MDTPNRARLILLVLGVAAVAAVIGSRLYQLQIDRAESLRARAKNQAQRTVKVHATRGSILDRRGRILATSIATQALYCHPWKVEDPDTAAGLLTPILELSRSEILGRLKSDKPFAYLERFLEPDQVRAVVDSGLAVGAGHAFGFLPSSRRSYPQNLLAAHVVGFANIDGDGLEGIEKQFDESLRGDPIVYQVVRDGRNGWLSRAAVDRPVTRPLDVLLSIDLELQHIVERELDRAMRESGSDAASAVLLDPESGRVLALANRPAADPNRFGKASAEARINRAVVHQFEPGSTFKVVPMAAALENGHLRPNQLFDCENGTYRVGSRTIHDISRHRLLSASQIIQRSSNIGMVKVARLLEPRSLHDTIVNFGFGRDTGIELPGEQSGALRPPQDWSSHSRDSLSFGQEIGVTVLQMASLFNTLANDGIQKPPRVVIGTRDGGGPLLEVALPAPRRVVSTRTARELKAMLEAVVARGTGTRARVEGHRLAGKSGTAQKIVDGRYSDTDFVASFGGFGPVAAPRLVCLVVVDAPRGEEYHGGQIAGPVFRRIMSAALAELRVSRDGEALTVSNPPTSSPDRFVSRELRPEHAPPVIEPTGSLPDVTGLSLREAIARLAARGYRVEIEGKGVVVDQHPAPGETLAPGRVCRLRLGDSVRVATRRVSSANGTQSGALR